VRRRFGSFYYVHKIVLILCLQCWNRSWFGHQTHRQKHGGNQVIKSSTRFRPAWIGPAAIVLGLSLPRTALALQPHGPPEGLYVHQMAHILFAGAMMFLLYYLRKERLPGLRWFTWSGILFILWNLNAMVGHAVEVYLEAQDFLGESAHLSRRLIMSGPVAWTYYLAKLDHLILVAAFIFLYFGLQALARAPSPLGQK
jgi:hypothetical protein